METILWLATASTGIIQILVGVIYNALRTEVRAVRAAVTDLVKSDADTATKLATALERERAASDRESLHVAETTRLRVQMDAIVLEHAKAMAAKDQDIHDKVNRVLGVVADTMRDNNEIRKRLVEVEKQNEQLKKLLSDQ